MNTYIIGLGSNLEPGKNIVMAKTMIAQKFKVLAESKFVQTKPVGLANQPDFINGALLIESELSPPALRDYLKEIERNLGRQRSFPKDGPRTIDLDLIVCNDKVVDQDFYERDFVKAAVLELSPQVKY